MSTQARELENEATRILRASGYDWDGLARTNEDDDGPTAIVPPAGDLPAVSRGVRDLIDGTDDAAMTWPIVRHRVSAEYSQDTGSRGKAIHPVTITHPDGTVSTYQPSTGSRPQPNRDRGNEYNARSRTALPKRFRCRDCKRTVRAQDTRVSDAKVCKPCGEQRLAARGKPTVIG
jgi:hypothetical protein